MRKRLREISKKWPRWGFRRAGAVLRMEGWKVNHKRVQRLWREEGLRVPPHSPKRRRLGNSTVPAAAAGGATQPGVGAGLHVRHDGRWPALQGALDVRRVHQGKRGRPGGPLDYRRRRGGRNWTSCGCNVVHRGTSAATTDRSSSLPPSATGAAFLAPAPASLTPARPGRTPTWRASTAGPGRALRPGDLRLHPRGPGSLRGLAPRLQSPPSPPFAGTAAACGLRSGFQQPETLTRSGLTNGVPSGTIAPDRSQDRGRHRDGRSRRVGKLASGEKVGTAEGLHSAVRRPVEHRPADQIAD